MTEISAQNSFLMELIQDVEFVMKGDEPNYVYWGERWGRKGARMVAAPLEIGALLFDQLYEKRRSIIFASATLSVRDSDTAPRQESRRSGLHAVQIRAGQSGRAARSDAGRIRGGDH